MGAEIAIVGQDGLHIVVIGVVLLAVVGIGIVGFVTVGRAEAVFPVERTL